MPKTIKKIALISLSFTFMMNFYSCAIHDIVHIVKYNKKIEKNLPDTFRVVVPLRIDPAGYFCIQAQINNQHNMDFLIDTGATGLIRSDTLKKLEANYWGMFPLSTKDAFGHKRKTALYHFNQLDIGSISFGQPLFMEVTKNDKYIYEVLHKSLLGTWVLKNLNWKFSMDDKKITLFSKTDYKSRLNETTGYIRIKGGTRGKNNKIFFPKVKQSEKFMFDSGFDGEIQITKKIFNKLSKQIPYRKFISERGNFIYLFEKVSLAWEGIAIPDCEVIYEPTSKLNLIGNKLMRRFNFVLAYGPSDSIHFLPSYDDLYIQPIKDFDKTKSDPYVSEFGFYTNKEKEKLIVSGIEIGGLAEKSGMKLKDEIISIDNSAFDLNTEFVDKNLRKYLNDKKDIIIDIKREGALIKLHLTIMPS